MRILKQPDLPLPPIPPGTPLKWSRWNDGIAMDDGSQVVFNTLHRSAVLMNASEDANDHVIALAALGMMVASGKDELAEFEADYEAAKRDMSYLDLTILTTTQCQMGCVYCFEGTKSKENLTDHAEQHILSFLESQKDTCRRLRITWFGGEPLLGYRRIKSLSAHLITFCHTHGIHYSADITTNGYALTADRCNELVQALKVKRFIITLDGTAATHDKRRPLLSGEGSFSRIWENIHALVDAGAWVTIRMTIDRHNADSIPSFLNMIAASPLAHRVGLSFCRTVDIGFTSASVRESLFTRQEFADVEWRLIRHAHSLGLWRFSFPYAAPRGGCLRDGDIVIGANGEVYKCTDTIGDARWQTGDISAITHAGKPEWYSQWLHWMPSHSDTCRHCKLMPLCSGGCPHNALFEEKKHGSASQCPDWKDNYIRQIKALIPEL